MDDRILVSGWVTDWPKACKRLSEQVAWFTLLIHARFRGHESQQQQAERALRDRGVVVMFEDAVSKGGA